MDALEERRAKRRAYLRQYRATHYEHVLAYDRAYRAKNSEKIKARLKAWRLSNAERIKVGRHTQSYRAYANMIRRDRYQNDPEFKAQQLALGSNYLKRRPLWMRRNEYGMRQARRSSAKIVDPDSVREFYRQIFSQPQATCAYCLHVFQISDIVVDHMKPFAWGGEHAVSNLTPSCKTCNLKKGSIPYDTWVNLNQFRRTEWPLRAL